MIADRIHMAFVEAHKLDVWIRETDTKGGKVLFVIPHAYTFVHDNIGREQSIRMTVESHRVVYTLPDPVQAAERRFSAGVDD